MIFSATTKNKTILFVIIISILLLGSIFWYWQKQVANKISDQTIFCDTDAKLCPDGTVVGRSGPQCEFALCPEEAPSLNQDTWLDFADQQQKISFKYPQALVATYISTVTWPPQVSVSNRSYSCQITKNDSNVIDKTSERKIASRTYCISTTSEGAAGSVYTDYTYTTMWQERLVSISFSLRYPQCYNYDDPQQSACQQEQENFYLDALIDKMVQSVTNLVD